MKNIHNRDVKTDLFNILSLVSCSDIYGFSDDIFFDAMGEITGDVTDKEINAFIEETFVDEEGYGEEDREEAKEKLTEWRDKYC